tara:strand:- start:738 stop:1097 length:360 start_codon:yes stop_codon:yes gene_type:complete
MATKGKLKKVSSQLKKSVKAHAKQVKIIDGYLQDSPLNKLKKTTRGKGRHFLSVKEGSGMTAAGRAAYKKENPGSTLSAPVTGDVKPGSKSAKRRKSFCARSKSWTSERGRAARKRWRC